MMTTRKKSSTTAVRSSTTPTTGKTTGQTKVKTRTLTATEEKVVRMRYGATVPGDMQLGRVGQDHPETRALLEAMEQRAIAAVSAQASPTKRKIVSALRSKNN
jgi:hypothetical protein